MSASSAQPSIGALSRPAQVSRPGLYPYLWSDSTRRIQVALGLVWLLDGGLQFQAFMYSHAFTGSLAGGAQGEPGWLHDSILWAVGIASHDLTLWNTLFALTQVGLGLGLLWRRTVRITLLASLAWVLVVWWFGEAFGAIFVAGAQPLTGAPGGVLIYALVGLLAWPSPRPGGLLGIRGARIQWAVLWSAMAYFWLEPASSGANAVSAMLTSTAAGIGPIDRLQTHLGADARGDGLVIALALAALSAIIATGVGTDRWARPLLWVSILLSALYWFIPQGLGGIFAGGATDPNAAPLFILLAAAMFPLVGRSAPAAVAPGNRPPIGSPATAPTGADA